MTKRYTNPSAEMITVLAGLDEVDAVFFEFANAIENIIRIGRSGRCSRSNDYLREALRDSSGGSQQGHRCCFIVDFWSLSDKSRVVFCPSRSISSFDEGMCGRVKAFSIREKFSILIHLFPIFFVVEIFPNPFLADL